MNLDQYKKIAPTVNADLEALFAKHGFKLGKLSAGVDPTSGTIRYSITVADTNLKDADGNTTSPEVLRWNRYAQMYGLKPEWLGRTIRLGGGKTFQITGLRDTRGAKCVMISSTEGKGYVTTVDDIKRSFALVEMESRVRNPEVSS